MFYIPDISKVYNSNTHKKHCEIETHNNSTYNINCTHTTYTVVEKQTTRNKSEISQKYLGQYLTLAILDVFR